jgi:hypothetical protein
LAAEPEKKNSISKLQIIQTESEVNKRKLSIEEEMKEFKETFRNKRLEKLYRKQFRGGSFPLFNFENYESNKSEKRQKLTLYGLDCPEAMEND